MNRKVKRILMALIGVALGGFCVGIFNLALLGADPFTVFVTGIGNLFGLGYGSVYTAVTGAFLLLVFFIDRHYIGIATIFNLFGIGFIAEITMNLIDPLFQGGQLWVRFGMLLFALVLLCFGSSLYFTADLGVSAYDAIALILSKKTPVSFRYCRIGTDLICVLIGFVCKATIGVGTVITAFFMGPIIQWFVEHVAQPILNGKKEEVVHKM
ncbi:MAG: YczE/YyaS/YitT family protein [Mobilitalea sp.]